jgi:Ca2+-binding EF-hand superfamily protein
MTNSLTRSILTLSLLGALAAPSFAQFPGGDRGGRGGDRGGFGGGDRGGRGGFGGGSPDPEMIWNMMSQGKDSINLNDPANARTKDRMMQQGQAIPANGILTKNDFKVAFERRTAERAAGGGMGGRGGPQTQTMTMTPGPNGQMMMSTNGGPATPVSGNPSFMGGQGGDRGGRGGFDPTGMSDDQVRSMMSRYELDPMGRISFAAIQNNSRGGALRDSFTQYDTNRDGFIDVTEYRGYLMARMNGGGMNSMSGGAPGMGGTPQGWSGGSPNNWQGGTPGGGAMPDRGRDRKAEEEEVKPVVYRFGNLPKEVPSWFEQQDTDKDGQIGLYEWRSAKKSVSDFEEYDLNGDGYVTAEEWLRKQRTDLTRREEEERMSKPAGTATTSGGGRGDRASFGTFGGGRGGPPGGGDRSPPSGRNPFTGSGGPPNGGGERGGRGGPGGRGGRGGDRSEETASVESKPTKEEKKAQKENRNPKD